MSKTAQHRSASTPPAPATLETRDAANYLGVTASFLRAKRLGTGGPAFVRFGRSIRYRIRDLDKWLEKHVVRPAAPATETEGRRVR